MKKPLIFIFIIVLCFFSIMLFINLDIGKNNSDLEEKNNSAVEKNKTSEKVVPILTYHNFTDEVADGANISPQRFKEHLLFLKENGYTAITQQQLVDFINGKGDLPSKPVMITIDDGYVSTYTHAYPILKELDMTAILFVITGRVGDDAYGIPKITWEQAQEMEKSGVIDIQSHTHLSHEMVDGKPVLSNKLPGETDEAYHDRVYNDLLTSKELIEQNLDKSVNALAYPYGSWNETVKNIATDVGYEIIYLFNEGTGPPAKGQDLLTIDRFGVSGNHTVEDIYNKFLSKYE